MVKLEEVLDESFREQQGGEEEWDTDDSDAASIASSLSDPDIDESLLDRLSALRDIVPPSTRRDLNRTLSSASAYVTAGLGYGGKALWVVATSVLLIGVPWAMAFAEEQQLDMMQAEMEAQQGGAELLTQVEGGAKPAF